MAAPQRPSEGGQAVPLLLVVLALATGAALFVSELAVAAVSRARAQTAADAAALAGAAAGRQAAEAAARANSASLATYRERGPAVAVEVALDAPPARAAPAAPAAAAAAEATPAVPDPGAAGGDRAGLAPVLVAAVARADQLLGQVVPVVSGFRSHAEQAALYADRARNPYPVAAPGSSMHEQGLAIDVPRSFVTTLLTVAADAGLCQVLPETDPIHFEPCPSTSPA